MCSVVPASCDNARVLVTAGVTNTECSTVVDVGSWLGAGAGVRVSGMLSVTCCIGMEASERAERRDDTERTDLGTEVSCDMFARSDVGVRESLPPVSQAGNVGNTGAGPAGNQPGRLACAGRTTLEACSAAQDMCKMHQLLEGGRNVMRKTGALQNVTMTHSQSSQGFQK